MANFLPPVGMSLQVRKKKTRKKEVIISVNSGSSSLKFSVFLMTGGMPLFLKGTISGTDTATGKLQLEDRLHHIHKEEYIRVKTFGGPVLLAVNILNEYCSNYAIEAIGHRIVHGGINSDVVEKITPGFLKK